MANISHISLLDPDSNGIVEDKLAKTISFFCTKRPVLVNPTIIEELKIISKLNGGRNVRVCLHDNPKSLHHDMIILEHRGKYYRPHKHERKGEAFHIIEGNLAIFAFSDDGIVIDAVKLNPSDIYRIEIGMYHSIQPITETVIYHENKPGPFEGNSDSIFADWSPKEEEEEEIITYLSKLEKYL